MKKKKITGKLNFKKEAISSLESKKVLGGTGGCTSDIICGHEPGTTGGNTTGGSWTIEATVINECTGFYCPIK